MLLDEEETKERVLEIISASKEILAHHGTQKKDPETGFVHLECHFSNFVLIEHQRQRLAGGQIRTNGLDLWRIESGNARKLLSVNYIPFQIKFFYKTGKLAWVDDLFALVPKGES